MYLLKWRQLVLPRPCEGWRASLDLSQKANVKSTKMSAKATKTESTTWTCFLFLTLLSLNTVSRKMTVKKNRAPWPATSAITFSSSSCFHGNQSSTWILSSFHFISFHFISFHFIYSFIKLMNRLSTWINQYHDI